ncbi:MAG: carboxypeptidase regulatory-like domain-containing protein, partial [Actinobacteria bacterium]|nr:carboxypeptidase regulatory-like domain-containing protein [Actinomycetota bacterium]
INGIYGARQFVQFRNAGTYTIVVTAMLGDEVEQVAERVVVSDPKAGVLPIPVIWATQDRYQPRLVVFSLPGSDENRSLVVEYEWAFGDGTMGVSQSGAIDHDYTDALGRDALYTTFDVEVTAHFSDQSTTLGRRSVSVFNTYALNKVRRGILTPRVAVDHPQLIPAIMFLPGEILCSFTITNLEDEDLLFSREKQEWLRADRKDLAPSDPNEPGLARSASVVARAAGTDLTVGSDLRVPALSTVTVVRVFPEAVFTGDVFGVAIHLEGRGTCSKLPVIASAYIEVKLPMAWSSYVSQTSQRALSFAAKHTAAAVLTLNDLREPVRSAAVAERLSGAVAAAATHPVRTRPSTDAAAADFEGTAVSLARRGSFPMSGRPLTGELSALVSPDTSPFDLHSLFDQAQPEVGQECDPDNMQDDLADGMVCQLTNEIEWRFVPGRILNAKKGDLLLDPGGPGLVGQLLRQVTPAQFYSHCAIMSKNHIELRHSTGSDDWLKDHLAGSFLGNKGTDGFDPTALKYLWPGSLTQTIDNAFHGEWVTAPDTGPYKIAYFSFAPDLSDVSTIIPPVVVKPPPFDETADVRRTLHRIADEALKINAHYRFYGYTRPEIALGPTGIAGADSGWAVGTVATQCASFIWLAAQHAGVKLEGPGKLTKVTDLEPTDVVLGGAVDAATLDGLYLYTGAERQAAAKWLYQKVFDIAYNAAGFWGQLFTGAPDDVANQLCNAFASDWTDLGDGGSGDSDAWKSTGEANAVSPDNLMLWDSPNGSGQGQFRSVYGHVEELFYLPGTYAQVPIYRWKLVPTKGNLTGTVTANADVTGANVSLLGSGQQDVVVGGDGRFAFTAVPAGHYSVSAGLNIAGHWNSNTVPVEVTAGGTTDVTVALQPPREVFRTITISVDMDTNWSSFWAHSDHPWSGAKSVKLHPFWSHGHLDFGGGDTPHGGLGFDIDLNADLSVTISWAATEVDDEVEATVNGGANVAKDSGLGWSGLTVVNPDSIDNDHTTMSFTIHNDQG